MKISKVVISAIYVVTSLMEDHILSDRGPIYGHFFGGEVNNLCRKSFYLKKSAFSFTKHKDKPFEVEKKWRKVKLQNWD